MSDRSVPAVAVVDADEPGNVGTIARAMKNFGFTDLVLIDPPELDPDGPAYGFAGQAREDILPAAETISFDEFIAEYHTIGFTARVGADSNDVTRYPYLTVDDLSKAITAVDANVALVFGREGTGLSNKEVSALDRICTIPAAASYPSLNLGQAATIALYEAKEAADPPTHIEPDLERAPEEDIERLYATAESYLAAIGHPPEKRPKTNRLVRRVFGRAHLTKREATTLIGLFRRGRELADQSAERR